MHVGQLAWACGIAVGQFVVAVQSLASYLAVRVLVYMCTHVHIIMHVSEKYVVV